jgi:sulfopyruvate decarboxylase TPP-binding subunit
MNKNLPYATAELLIQVDLAPLLVVPSSGLDPLYANYDRKGECIYATREEEAIAIAVGLTLGGRRPVVVMQQSGVGNCLNAIFSLADCYSIFFPILVFDRGEHDINPVQRISSHNTKMILSQLKMSILDPISPDAAAQFQAELALHTRWFLCPM